MKLSRDGYIFKYTDLRSHPSFQKKLGDNQLLKLPGGKYTVREREMLLGILPKEFFNQASQAVNNPFAIGASICESRIYVAMAAFFLTAHSLIH